VARIPVNGSQGREALLPRALLVKLG